MSALYFICPNTKQRASTGIETDARTLQMSWSKKLKINCPHCGEVHESSIRDVYVDGALDEYMAAEPGRSALLQN
jgi:hypothetical protein